jgi:hypothetical protein
LGRERESLAAVTKSGYHQSVTNEEIVALEQRINELKKLYDNYFAGIERREPLIKREKLALELRRISVSGQSNTQVQFRFNNMRARWATLEAHWTRLLKLLEEGKLKRTLAAQQLAAATEQAKAQDLPASAPPRVAPQQDANMKALYDKYAASRASTGETPVSYESMVASLKKQVPAVIERYKCKAVDFRVAQKDGKTIIKAVPIT